MEITFNTSDGPINDRTEDRLDRKHFAGKLAESITRRKGRDSFVIALQGPWGCGKSSIKNMVIDALEDKSIDVVEFAPWQLRDTDAVFQAFFGELILAIKGNSPDNEARAQQMELYSRRLAFGGNALQYISKATSLLGIPLASPFIEAAGEALKKSGEIAKEGSEALKGEDQSLSSIKKGLYDSLKELERPILVVIDDIDRLAPDEVTLILQLVKSNADFPNFTYLLLYQRESVERAIFETYGIDGQEYLEKIVQLPIDVPPANPAQLKSLLSEGIKGLAHRNEWALRETQLSEVSIAWANGLGKLIENPRDLKRLLNAFDFIGSLFYNEGRWEINIADFMAVEALRLQQPALYTELPKHKEILTGYPFDQIQKRSQLRYNLPNTLDSADSKLPSEVEVRSLTDTIQGEQKESICRLLCFMFPRVAEWAFDSKTREGVIGADRLPLGIGSGENFERYFELTIPDYQLSESERVNILNSAHEKPLFLSSLHQLYERDLLGVFLSRVKEQIDEDDTDEIISRNREQLLINLVDFFDELINAPTYIERKNKGNEYSFQAILELYRKLVRNHSSIIEERGLLVLNNVRNSTGIYVLIPMLEWEEDTFSHKDSSIREDLGLLTEEQASEARSLCEAKISQMAVEGTLWQHEKARQLIACWGKQGNRTTVKNWLKDQLNDEGSLLKLLHHFGGRTYGHRNFDFGDSSEFASLLDLHELGARVTSIKDNDLSSDDRDVVDAFLSEFDVTGLT